MKAILTNNISKKSIETDSGPWVPPVLPFGETLTLGLRFAQDVAGATVEPPLAIDHFKAALGRVDARPESGTWCMQCGAGGMTADNTTGPIPYDASAEQVKTAINAKTTITDVTGVVAEVQAIDGSWRILFGTGAAEITLTLRKNKLWPASFANVSAYQQDGVWYHEVRLTQSPVAFADSGERILPDPPSVTEAQEGGASGGASWNEVQTLYVPPNFRGTYILRSGLYARTEELSIADTAATIQAALEAMLGAGNVVVALTADQTARIEFIGTLAGASQTLTVTALNAPPGDYTFDLPLDRWELWTILRRVESVTLPLEVRIWVTEGSGEDAVVVERAGFRVNLVITRPVLWDQMGLVPGVDWLRPMSPRDYTPFSRETVLLGQHFYPSQIGDGVITSDSIAHGLATEIVFPFVYDIASGALLANKVDYTFVVDDNDSVTITSLIGAIPATKWEVIVGSAQTIAAFADGLTVTIGQVTGLRTELDAIEATVAALAAQAATVPLGITLATGEKVVTITLPDYADVFPGIDPPGALVPAIHDATISSLGGGLPDPTAHTGEIYKNQTGVPVLLPGGGRIRSSLIEVDGYLGSDGRTWRPFTHRGVSKSFFPRDFEKELWMAEVSAQMLRAGTTLNVNWTIELALLEAITRAQYLIVLEHGTVPSQANPVTTSTNLYNILWNATPIFTQRVIVGPVPVAHKLGAQIIRAAGGGLSANKVIYGLAAAADAVPTSPDVALRCRLIDFDTENSVLVPRGAVSRKLSGGTLVIG